jgi:hypothetical protein
LNVNGLVQQPNCGLTAPARCPSVNGTILSPVHLVGGHGQEIPMKNAGLIAAGIAGAALLTVGAGFALGGAANSPAPLESSVSADEPRGMTEAQMEARIADERAAAEARAQARIDCQAKRQEESNKGALIGGVAGAVIGSNVAGDGAKSEGGVIGALAGASVGRNVAKDRVDC